MLATLDAHAHIDPNQPPGSLINSGAVLAMTCSLDEAALASTRQDELVAWGVGCHPRRPRYQDSFDAGRFADMVERFAFIGEVGLDTGSRVPLEKQLSTFRQILAIAVERPRLVSIHSYRATGLVLQELKRIPLAFPVLHWWTGTSQESREAVAMGCYFSIHSAVARHSRFRVHVPLERVLLESDHGYNDPPAAIPCRIEWVSHLVAQQYQIPLSELRQITWQNLARIIQQTESLNLLPGQFSTLLVGIS